MSYHSFNSLGIRKLHLALLALMLIIGISACKKDDDETPACKNEAPTTGTRTQFTLDSIFLYAKEVYYWQDALPCYDAFDPRNRYAGINPELSAYRQELFDITQYKLNAAGVPIENPINAGSPRYSYLERNASKGFAFSAGVASSFSSSVMHQIIEINNKKVAYLKFDSFDLLSNMRVGLDAAFDEFANAGAETLIVDLRNNGGGYVETAAEIADRIAPTSLNGKTMFSELFNPILRSGKAEMLKNQLFINEDGNSEEIYDDVLKKHRLATMADANFAEADNITKFSKKGKLETVKNLYFIVTGRTASASELLISSFKPHLSVRLVGQRTYGKPVGFFGIDVDKYTVYLASFLLRNADGWSDYFDGIPADIPVTGEPSAPIGDPRELYLATALSDIIAKSKQKGSVSIRTTARVYSEAPSSPLQSDVDYIPLVKKHFKLKE